MGFLMGLLLGAIAALLYSPKAGDEVRDELRTRSEDLRKRADDLQRIAQKITGEAQSKGKELICDARSEWDRSAGTEAGGTSGSGRTGSSDLGRPTGTA
ncbi:hypothetical protein BH18CHL2_BH18CHL2_10010 [soil metagenome]